MTADAIFQSTPPRGGDFQKRPPTADDKHFNPRPLAGATVDSAPDQLNTLFQSTPPRGGDSPPAFLISIFPAFQSTPPRGGDLTGILGCWTSYISIHAPSRGRPGERSPWSQPRKFQSTPPRGGDGVFSDQCCHGPISIHAPSRGRLDDDMPFSQLALFQSTPPRGGDGVKHESGQFPH